MFKEKNYLKQKNKKSKKIFGLDKDDLIGIKTSYLGVSYSNNLLQHCAVNLSLT